MPSHSFHPIRRAHALNALGVACTLTLGVTLAATPVRAQQTQPQQAQPQRAGEVMGLRYLSWSGKAEAPTPRSSALRRGATAAPPRPLNASTDARYPGIGSMARPSRYGPGTGSNGLTPASAWASGGRAAGPPSGLEVAPPRPLTPGIAPVYATQPASDPQAQIEAQAQMEAQAQAAYQAQIQSQYQTWYQQEAQRQYQSQVEAQMQTAPALQQQPPMRVQAPAGQVSAGQVSAGQVSAGQTATGFAPPMPAPTETYRQQADAGSSGMAADPMAPRRDARIFQMQQPQGDAGAPAGAAPASTTPALATPALAPPTLAPPSQPAPQNHAQNQANQAQAQTAPGTPYGAQTYAAAGPPREGARYYSVHRAEGRQPDPIAIPASIYTPIDLAEPPAQPVQTRNVNGRLQAVVPNADPSLP